MKVEWDYTCLAQAYLKRPDYSRQAIDAILARAGMAAGERVCDIGAGVAHLTIPLLERGLVVDAVEPNEAMRSLGRDRTAVFPAVSWHEGTGEATGREGGRYALVTFGSSFNVCDRTLALRETARLLRPEGWFACLWNHRDLEEPTQAAVEALIRRMVPGYAYGIRREDQSEVIAASGLFGPVEIIEGRVFHTVPVTDWVEAWRSHASLARQAGAARDAVVAAIDAFLAEKGETSLTVPYVTRAWMAQKKG